MKINAYKPIPSGIKVRGLYRTLISSSSYFELLLAANFIKELNITVLKSITAIKVIKITKPELTRNDSEFKSMSILIIGNSNS